MSAVNAIINIVTSAIVLALLLYALKRDPKIKVYYFFIVGVAISLAGAILALVGGDSQTAIFGSKLAYLLSNCIFILGISYLIRVWLRSLEWEIEDKMARRLRSVTMLIYIVVPLATVLLIVNIGLYLGGIFDATTFTAIDISLSWVIVAALGLQAFVVGWFYFRESKGVANIKRSQLLRLVIFATLMFAAALIYALTFWIPSIAAASYIIAFIWLAVLVWPGALSGFDKDVESAGAGSGGGGGGGNRRNDVPLRQQGGRNAQPSPFTV